MTRDIPTDDETEIEEKTMQRSGHSTVPRRRSDVLDYVADYAHDAVDAGLEPGDVAGALREAAVEIEDGPEDVDELPPRYHSDRAAREYVDPSEDSDR